MSNIALDSEVHAAAVLSQLSMRTIVAKLRTEDNTIVKEILYLLTNLLENSRSAFMHACAREGVIAEVVAVSDRLHGDLRNVANEFIRHALRAELREEGGFGVSPDLIARLPDFERDPMDDDASNGNLSP